MRPFLKLVLAALPAFGLTAPVQAQNETPSIFQNKIDEIPWINRQKLVTGSQFQYLYTYERKILDGMGTWTAGVYTPNIPAGTITQQMLQPGVGGSTDAGSLTSGTLGSARLPAFGGDVSGAIGALTVNKVNGQFLAPVALSGSASDLASGSLSSSALLPPALGAAWSPQGTVIPQTYYPGGNCNDAVVFGGLSGVDPATSPQAQVSCLHNDPREVATALPDSQLSSSVEYLVKSELPPLTTAGTGSVYTVNSVTLTTPLTTTQMAIFDSVMKRCTRPVFCAWISTKGATSMRGGVSKNLGDPGTPGRSADGYKIYVSGWFAYTPGVPISSVPTNQVPSNGDNADIFPVYNSYVSGALSVIPANAAATQINAYEWDVYKYNLSTTIFGPSLHCEAGSFKCDYGFTTLDPNNTPTTLATFNATFSGNTMTVPSAPSFGTIAAGGLIMGQGVVSGVVVASTFTGCSSYPCSVPFTIVNGQFAGSTYTNGNAQLINEVSYTQGDWQRSFVALGGEIGHMVQNTQQIGYYIEHSLIDPYNGFLTRQARGCGFMWTPGAVGTPANFSVCGVNGVVQVGNLSTYDGFTISPVAAGGNGQITFLASGNDANIGYRWVPKGTGYAGRFSGMTLTEGPGQSSKQASAPSSAVGAGVCQEQWVTGTNAGTCKKIAICGTSNTPSLIVDNVGSGC